jgi:hypothetical protein
MSHAWWFLSVAAVVVVIAVLMKRPWQRRVRAGRLYQAKRRFHTQRERLEAKFIQLAAAHAKPDAPRWGDCTFSDDVAYVRNRATGELSAFVAVTVATEALHRLPPGTTDLVSNFQAGTAVFRFDRDGWVTDGRAILNLSPNEAIHYYRDDLEIVGEERASQR